VRVGDLASLRAGRDREPEHDAGRARGAEAERRPEAAGARESAAGHERERAWRAEAARWRAEALASLRGLGAAIDGQLARWGLTAAESEVALFILEGHGYKEIARRRGTSERTVRQQAQAVFRKAGLEGRAELAAFFLGTCSSPRARPGARCKTPRRATRFCGERAEAFDTAVPCMG
jgi:DNA-binding CsgD family transcriptional regulator